MVYSQSHGMFQIKRKCKQTKVKDNNNAVPNLYTKFHSTTFNYFLLWRRTRSLLSTLLLFFALRLDTLPSFRCIQTPNLYRLVEWSKCQNKNVMNKLYIFMLRAVFLCSQKLHTMVKEETKLFLCHIFYSVVWYSNV